MSINDGHQENKTKEEFEFEDVFISKWFLNYMKKHKKIFFILGYILLICVVNLYFIWASIYWTNSSKYYLRYNYNYNLKIFRISNII